MVVSAPGDHEHPVGPARERELEEENKRLHLALRNCLALAQRQLRRALTTGASRVVRQDWTHIVRFCAEAGVKPTFLRTEEDPHEVPMLRPGQAFKP